MRKCKVKNCNRKHHGKGYCIVHYTRKLRGKPLTKRCKDCGKNLTNKLHIRYCKSCRKKRIKEYWKKRYLQTRKEFIKENYTYIPVFRRVKGTQYRIFTNGLTKEIQQMIPKIKERVLNDCIRNPKKYLRGDIDETASKKA